MAASVAQWVLSLPEDASVVCSIYGLQPFQSDPHNNLILPGTGAKLLNYVPRDEATYHTLFMRLQINHKVTKQIVL